MKNKKYSQLILPLTVILLIFLVPLIINISYTSTNPILITIWSGSDFLIYYGSVLSFLGTTILGYSTIKISHQSNIISKHLLNAELERNLPIIDFLDVFEEDISKYNDNIISLNLNASAEDHIPLYLLISNITPNYISKFKFRDIKISQLIDRPIQTEDNEHVRLEYQTSDTNYFNLTSINQTPTPIQLLITQNTVTTFGLSKNSRCIPCVLYLDLDIITFSGKTYFQKSKFNYYLTITNQKNFQLK